MQVVAEGIEHPRQLAELREMGCGYGQGFLVASPMAASGVESLVRTGTAKPAAGPDGAAGGLPGAGGLSGGAGPSGVADVSGAAKPGVPAA
jgi:predicted signal transduction protein with EAL and GGDEF domain